MRGRDQQCRVAALFKVEPAAKKILTVVESRAHRRASAAALSARSEGGPGLGGLVSSSTSRTLPLLSGEVEVNQALSRVRRLRRRVLTVARLHEWELVGVRTYPAMVTLTYQDGADWRAEHIAQYIGRVQAQFKRDTGHRCRYVWVAELQQRGAMHYHVVFWLPAGYTLPKSDLRGWWLHGNTKTEAARAPVAYLTKYATKAEHASGFPPGARIHGSGGLAEDGRNSARWWALPTWARSHFGVACDCVRRQGGGLAGRVSDLYLSSPWRVSLTQGRVLVRQVLSHLGGLAEVLGPYSLLTSKVVA